jgi:DNA-binding transcriptional ArsR family regulator
VGCDRLFLALANPVRRQLLEILTRQPLSAGELSGRFDLSRPAVAEHLKVLRDAGLVADEARGRRRIYRLTAEPLAELGQWLHPFEKFWCPLTGVSGPDHRYPNQRGDNDARSGHHQAWRSFGPQGAGAP